MKIKIRDNGYKFTLKIDYYELIKIGITPNDLTDVIKSICGGVEKNKKEKEKEANVSN